MADPFFSELRYRGGANQDFIEVAVDEGFDVTGLIVTIYVDDGTIRSSSDLSVLTPTTVNGRDVYVLENGDATNFNGIALSQAASLSQNGTVFSFVSFDNTPDGVTATEGPADGLTSTDIGQAGAGSSLETQDGGGTYFTQTDPDPNNVTCFAAGTHIETRHGLMKVENLKRNDLIYTFDRTYKPLRGIFRRRVEPWELSKFPKLRPVRITAGALGSRTPQHDLLVSRQHRMVVSSPIAKRMFETDVLVAAIRLTNLPGIYVDENVRSVDYFHLLFDSHDVIFAEGAATESLFLGAETLRALPKATRAEINAIFPTLNLPLKNHASKLPVPPHQRQAQLVRRHLKNRRNLV